MAFSPDGKTLAAGYGGVGGVGGGVVLWDVAGRSGSARRPLAVKEGDVRAWPSAPTARPSPPDTVGGVRRRRRGAVGRGRAERLAEDPLPVEEGGVTSVAFSPDGKTLAAGYGGVGDVGGGVVLWDVAGAQRLAADPLPVEEGDVTSVAFSPDGKTLAAGYGVVGGGGGVVLWDVAARRAAGGGPAPREGGRRHERGLQPRRQDPRRRIRRRRRRGGGVVLWDVARRSGWRGPAPREGGRRHERGLQPRRQDPRRRISTAASAAAAAWCCGTWPRERLAERPAPRQRGRRPSVAFSPDGKTSPPDTLGDVGVGGGVVLWDVAAATPGGGAAPREGGRRQERGLQPRRQDPRRRIRRRRRRRRRGAVGRGRAERLAAEPLPVKEGDVTSVAFSPDGKTLAAGYDVVGGGGGVVLWDVAARSGWRRSRSP